MKRRTLGPAVAMVATTRLLRQLACVCLLLGPAQAADLDDDGLDDDRENQLIERYRPYLLYDSRNDKWQASALWFVSRSDFYYVSPPPTRWHLRVYTAAQLRANPELILGVDTGNGVLSNSAVSPVVAPVYLDPFASRDAGGEGPCEPVGAYAHVVPVTLPIRETYGLPLYPPVDDNAEPHRAILVQYFQFFPYNDSQSSWGGDHEGDWVYLDVYVEDTPAADLIAIVHHHHGDGSCDPTVTRTLSVPANLSCGQSDITPAPVCYLEEDNHEWWPWAGDNDQECDFFGTVDNDSHDGAGIRRRMSNVKNLGEQFAPIGDLDSRLAIGFNGAWGNDRDGDAIGGDAPDGFAVSGVHFFPRGPVVVAYVRLGSSMTPSERGAGSRYHPVGSIASGLQLLREGGVLRLESGAYSDRLGLGHDQRRLRLEARHGTVTIGR